MTPDLVYAFVGGALLLAVVLPAALHRQAVSAPMVLLGVGALIGLLPMKDGASLSPVEHRVFVEHLTEVTVIIALMGVGLALDRPLRWSRLRGWGAWSTTWRMLGIAMPLCIGGVLLLGWGVLGLAPAAALLLGAALAPTDPVLASDVQVGGPTVLEGDAEEHDGIDEDDEVRFALTSEAGLNDGLAFPFVYAAILLSASTDVSSWFGGWLAWDLVGRILLGVAVGAAIGWVLSRIAFRSPAPSLRLAETGEPLLALAAVLLSYGVAEAAHGYGFLAVFACALTLRSAERGHSYHEHMHAMIERLERLLTLVVLLLLGMSLTNGLLIHLTWQGVVLGLTLLLVIRPISGVVALFVGRTGRGLELFNRHERLAVAFFGVRGVGSLFYLAFATGQGQFGEHHELWATVGFTVTASVLLHGITATPWLRRLEHRRDPEAVG